MVALPLPFSTLRRTHLLFNQPTPIEQLHRLTTQLDCGVTLWIKREDCNSGLAFGGNKVRKLEYVLQDAIDTGADTIVTTGGLQSNHMRQTAAAAARLGLKVRKILWGYTGRLRGAGWAASREGILERFELPLRSLSFAAG